MNGEGNWINQNHKARIFAKPAEALKKWFEENISEGDKIIFTKNEENNYTFTEISINKSSIKETTLQDIPIIKTSENDKWDKEKDWFWEGNIQQKISDYLILAGFTEVKTVNTALKDKGPDISGEKDGIKWVIEVKGYPSDKYVQDTDRYTKGEVKRTNPPTQARHWFSEALTSILLTKSEDPTKMICLGFPQNDVYASYLNRISYIRGKLDIYVFLVDENEKVKLYHPYQQIGS
jgi:hypothetical protein